MIAELPSRVTLPFKVAVVPVTLVAAEEVTDGTVETLKLSIPIPFELPLPLGRQVMMRIW